MSPSARHDESPPARHDDHPAEGRARRWLNAAPGRYRGSWVQAIVAQLKALHFFEWTTIFGAELLWSALPLIILLSSLADERIDDDLSRHVGLNAEGAQIVSTLFRGTPAHGVEPILTGFLFCFSGVVAVVSSLQLIYERIFGQEPRGWRNLPRGIAWVGVLFALLAFDGVVNRPVHHAAGAAGLDVI